MTEEEYQKLEAGNELLKSTHENIRKQQQQQQQLQQQQQQKQQLRIEQLPRQKMTDTKKT